MRPIDLCTAALVTTGNRALSAPSKTRWDAVEELLGLSLRAQSSFDSRVTFVDAGGERLSFQEWLENRPAPSARLGVSPFPPPDAADPILEEILELSEEVRAAIYEGGLGFLVYSDGQRVERFVPREIEPLAYDISGPQLLAFIQGRTHATALSEVLANELELPVEQLAEHLEPRSPSDMQYIIERFMAVGAEIEHSASGDEGPEADQVEQWNAFFSTSPSSAHPSFEYLYVGTSDAAHLEQDLDAARASLASTLEGLQDFARSQRLHPWSKVFRRALLRLSLEPQPLDDLVELLQLNGLPTPVIQLAVCASSADVFGGIGSWNDMAFEGESGERYLQLSDQLLASVKAALRSSLNRSVG
jgi:hypothetical protein